MSDEILKKIHVFEKAKLGKAPFVFIEMEVRDGGIPGACQYCGKDIIYCFLVESSDGRRFHVGSDCILKSDDSGLVDVVTTKKAEIEKAKREAKKKFHQETLKTIARKVLEKYSDNLKVIPGIFNYSGIMENERDTAFSSFKWMVDGDRNTEYYLIRANHIPALANLISKVAKIEVILKPASEKIKILEIYT